MGLMTRYNEFAYKIDQCASEEELKGFQTDSSVGAMQREFWAQRLIVFTSQDSLEKKKAIVKLQWIQQFFGCSIPLAGTVKRFTAPKGFYGIMIASNVVLEDSCVILPQVYIGPNLLLDNNGPGFPVIGKNVYIGAGAKIIGNVVIGDNVRIDANCCILEDIPANSHVKNNGSYVVHSDEIMNNAIIPVQKQLSDYYDVPKHIYERCDGLTVEVASEDDLDTIMKMYKDRINWFKWKKIRQWSSFLVHHPREEFLEKIRNGHYYVIKDKVDIVAGFSLSSVSESWEDEVSNAYYLSRSISRIDCKGMGKIITEFAKSIALTDGKEYLRLECIYSNERLNHIWNELGFSFVRETELDYHAALRELKL